MAAILMVASGAYAQMDISGERGCEYIWKQGVFGETIGVNSFYTGDIDNDGITEIICSAETHPSHSHSSTFWYILEYDEQLADYRQVWISDGYPEETGLITAIDVIDADYDGQKKICVAISTGVIEVFNASTLLKEAIIRIPNDAEDREITTILSADADNDNQQELVCCTSETTFLFRMPGYSLKHRFDYGSIDLKCGNVNADPWVELVYANGYVICITSSDPEPQIVAYFAVPYHRALQLHFEISDIDGDQMLEFIQTIDNTMFVWDVDTKTLKFSKNFGRNLWGVLVADANGDGNPEITIAKEGNNNEIICMDVQGNEQWRISSEYGSGVAGIAIGDFDNDNEQEIMWISGTQTTEIDYIYVYSLMPERVRKWKSTYIEPPYVAVKVADLDGDGQKEIVTLRGNDGKLSVFDALTHQPQWVSESYGRDPYDFEIFDIDYDGQMEIILCGQLIRVIDGSTHELESSHYVPGLWDDRRLEIADIDNNGMHEYIISDGNRIVIMDPTDYGILWESGDKSSPSPEVRSLREFSDFMVGNVDDDPELEILLNRNGLLTCYDVVNHQEFTMQVEPLSSACLFDRDKDGIMEIYLCAPNGSLGVIDARTQSYAPLPLTINANVNEIKIFDPPTGETPVMAFLYDDKFRFLDFDGRLGIPKVTGDYFSDRIELFDTGNDGISEIFLVSYNMVTEFRSDCFMPLGKAETFTSAACRVYPNPTESLLCLELSQKTTEAASATLFNMQGKRLAEFNLVGGKNEIDMSPYSKGLYLLNVNTGNEFFSVKVIRK